MQSMPPFRRRKLRTWSPGLKPNELKEEGEETQSTSLIDLASNDYLGLSRHPSLTKAAQEAMIADGVGAGASRFVTGGRPVHLALEEALASWLGRERIFLFPSGFQANLAAVIALANRHSIVIADKHIHHSLLIGVKASGARLQRFAHNDLNDLEQRLKSSNNDNANKPLLVLTESLFSMEGTSPPLKKVADLCKKYKAKLLVDEAHALGVMGPQGRGLCHGLKNPALVMISGTFGKAFGSGGAFLATNKNIGDFILQNSGAFRYTTALAPPLAAAALAALKLIKSNSDWGLSLQQDANKLRNRLEEKGWSRPPGFGQILSLVIGHDKQALAQQRQLEASGLLSVAIRPPTVPEGTARLRLALRKDLPSETWDKLISSLGER